VEEACSRMILVPAVNMPCMTLQHAAGAPLSLLCTEKKSMGKRLSVKTKVNGTCRWAKVGNRAVWIICMFTLTTLALSDMLCQQELKLDDLHDMEYTQ
jgi:hypothetical protein